MNKRSYHLKRKYGITEEDYASLLSLQGGCCAICRRPQQSFRQRLAVDHDHSENGEVRGLVCTFCNRYVIGRYKRKDLDLIKSLLAYLDRKYTGWVVPPKKKKKRRRCRKIKKKQSKDG